MLRPLFPVDAKEAEMKELLQEKDLNVEEMKKKLKDQEKQRQSELLKLQMEVLRICKPSNE